MMETMMNENNLQQKEVEMEELQQLLKDVYEATKGIKQEKAEAFDVIGICIGTQETIHSKFLAELLNPHGSHGLGSAFLEAFYEQIELNELTPKNSSIKTEFTCPEGKMDIVISNENDTVVIENKIYALDQSDQLKRYSEWLNKQEKANKKLIYLTLDGHEASNAKGIDYQQISYRNDILQWLDKCIAEIFKNTLPAKDGKTNAFAKKQIDERNAFIKKLLLQYKELIKKLTRMDMEPEMKNKISEVITSNKKNYLAAALTAKAFDSIHQVFLRNIVKKACEEEREKWPWGKEMEWEISTNKYNQFGISYTPKGKQYKLFFEFQMENYQKLYYGLHDLSRDRGPHPYTQTTINRPNGFDGPNEHGWIAGAYANTDFQNWDAESLLQHWDNDFADIKENIKGYIANLMEIIKNNPALDDEKYK